MRIEKPNHLVQTTFKRKPNQALFPSLETSTP
jgi:hypothetical protein